MELNPFPTPSKEKMKPSRSPSPRAQKTTATVFPEIPSSAHTTESFKKPSPLPPLSVNLEPSSGNLEDAATDDDELKRYFKRKDGLVLTRIIRREGRNVKSLPLREELERHGWELVRHCPSDSRGSPHWYYANDKLEGTAEYGDPRIWAEETSNGKEYLAHHPSAKQWSKRFDMAKELLVSSGDGSKWLVIHRHDIIGKLVVDPEQGQIRQVLVQRSSETSTPHVINMPVISEENGFLLTILDEKQSFKRDGTGVVYGENYTDLGIHKDKGFGTLVRCGGANVYARGGHGEETDDAIMHRWEKVRLSSSTIHQTSITTLPIFFHVGPPDSKEPFSVIKGACYYFYQDAILPWLARQFDSGNARQSNSFGRRGGSKSENASSWVDQLMKPEIMNAIMSISPDYDSVRTFLIGVLVRGLIRGPLRHCVRHVAQVGSGISFEPGQQAGFKWCGAVKLNDGRLIFVPRQHKHAKVLMYEPSTGLTEQYAIEGFKSNSDGLAINANLRNLYNSCVLGADGCIYGIPACAEKILKVDPRDPDHVKCTLLDIPPDYMAFFKGDWKWGNGVLASNGKIYSAPSFCDRVLCIDTHLEDPTVHLSENVFCDKTKRGKWWGAVLWIDQSDNNHEYVIFTPEDADRVLKFDIGTENEYVPNEKAGEHHVHMKTPGHLKWHGACLCNDHVVAVPNCAATKVLVYNPKTLKFWEVGVDLGTSDNKWYDSVLGLDGKVYGIPLSHEKVLIVDVNIAVKNIDAAENAQLEADSGSMLPTRQASRISGMAGMFGRTAGRRIVEDRALQLHEDPSITTMSEFSLKAHSSVMYSSGVLADDGFIYACPAATAQILRIDTMPQIQQDGEFGSAQYLWRVMPELFFYIICNYLGERVTLADQCGADLKTHEEKTAAADRVAGFPNFLGVLFGVSDATTRSALLAVPFVKMVLLNVNTVKKWNRPTLDVMFVQNPKHKSEVGVYFRRFIERTKFYFSSAPLVDYIKTISAYDRNDSDSDLKFRKIVAEWSTTRYHFRENKFSCAPLLLIVVLEIGDVDTRRELLSTNLMRDLIGCTSSVGLWITHRFDERSTYTSTKQKDPVRPCASTFRDKVKGVQDTERQLSERIERRETVFDYFRELSRREQSLELFEEIDSVNVDFIPMLQKLKTAELDEALQLSAINTLVTLKLLENGIAITVDITLRFIHLFVYCALVSNRKALNAGPSTVVVGALFCISTFYVALGALKLGVLHLEDRSVALLCNGWFRIDAISYLVSYVEIGLCLSGRSNRLSPAFRVIASVGIVLFWLRVLGAVKVLSKKLSVFVYTLSAVLFDLREFLVVFCMVLVMFSQIFYVINSTGHGNHVKTGQVYILDDGPEVIPPFGSPGISVFTVFLMMGGNVVRSMFDAETNGLTAISVAVFVIFIFIVVIVLLNVLIAVVSDSYQTANEQGNVIFRRSQFEVVVDLSGEKIFTLSKYFTKRSTNSPSSKLFVILAKLFKLSKSSDDFDPRTTNENDSKGRLSQAHFSEFAATHRHSLAQLEERIIRKLETEK